ncbi:MULTISPECIES: HDOD domain-containing protein [unclassified Massilia]|uniref:HDOD domain-containing protein n=1 Tax=unclassified Massilia TaxID=2609279 RepID=UPI001B82C2B3|nr:MULTISPECIES: HDOD domain-containing protein [unclassified Massilia]MBQ5941662.1 HDOD domain-containing protein [Massilia sp. AB1]MBQ5962937.1 HDOD domain-containing protein [Massilia sp. ZL223]
MAAQEQDSIPLVAFDPVANAQNEWVALCVRVEPGENMPARLQAVFGMPDLLAAIAPLDGLLMVDSPAALTPPVLALLPANRIGFVVAADALLQEGAMRRLGELHETGYRVWLDGAIPEGVKAPAALRSVARDCGADAPPPGRLAALFGPHLARNVHTALRFSECENAGFDWFSGDYPLDPASFPSPSDDGSSRRRLLTLLGLLARDADSRELELQLKQDPTLSYHLLKLVNSAAFAVSTQITSFNQAINLLGRRQLQRWLQLLLYARQQPDGPPNLLLPLAARRGAQLEALCKHAGGSRDEQDLAFMTGVFSLLDRLLRMPMHDIAADLCLPEHIAGALLERSGTLGGWLRLTEIDPLGDDLERAGVTIDAWWNSQLHAYHWAIQVGRNV